MISRKKFILDNIPYWYDKNFINLKIAKLYNKTRLIDQILSYIKIVKVLQIVSSFEV